MNPQINISDLSLDVIDNIQHGIHIYHLEDLEDDRTLRMLYANNASELYTGVPSEKLIGNTLDENFPGLRKEGIPQQYAEVVRSGKPIEIEAVFYGDDQVTEGWFAVKAFPVSHNCVGVSFENITDKKKTEEALKDSCIKLTRQESLLHSIFKSAPIGINLAIDRIFYWVNEKFTDITGYSSDELKGQSARMLFPNDEEFIRVGREVYGSIEKHGTGSIDTQWQRKDGSIIDVYLSATTVDLDYLPNGVTFSVLDISDRKSLERALSQSKDEWEKTFDAMSDIVTIQNKNMCIVRANKAAANFFKMDYEDLIGKQCFEIFRGTPSPCPGCPGSNVLLDIQNHSEIIEHAGLGKIFHVASSPILDKNNEVQYLVHVAKDITEQKRLEEELFQAHKMEAIGTLAGGIAHDFNNILSAIIGFSELALLDVPADSDATRNITGVLKSSHRAAALVRQILLFSRKSDHRLEPIDPNLIIIEALKMLRATLPATIAIHWDSDIECGKIMADPTNIHQIIVNFCTNALHAMEGEKGMIRVSLQRKEISADQIIGEPGVSPGPFIVLQVSDTGHGMDQATRERIFEPYFTTKEVGKGTGLGLAVIHGIIQDYHGFIKVTSEPGKGTTFDVYFPALQQEISNPDEHKTDQALPTGTERILVVDDESMIMTLNKRVLDRLGYNVSATTKSLEALEKIRSDPEQFDLIITDQTMPTLTGAELAQEILKIKHNMPIIICTGYSGILSEKDALAIGITKYVRKPVDRTTLAKIVRQVLDEQL